MEQHLRWHHLRAVGNSPLIRASVAMPLVGYLLLLNEQVVQVADIAPRFRLFASENPWRLVLVYHGTFFLGVASALYLIRCPPQVRKYDSAVEYQNAELGFFETHADYLEEVVGDEATRIAGQPPDHGRVLAVEERLRDLRGMFGFFGLHPNSVSMMPSPALLMTCHWHLRDLSRPASRACVAVLYALGFSLLAIPTVVTFAGVARYTIRLVRPLIASA